MSAWTMMRAAEAIRSDHGIYEQAFHLAVADWLESVYHDGIEDDESEYRHALRVARAYLGGDA